MSCIETTYVQRRISLGVTERLGLGKGRCEVAALLEPADHEAACTVQDGIQLQRLTAAQNPCQWRHSRRSGHDRCLEVEAPFLQEGQELLPVFRQGSLVAGYDPPAILQSAQHEVDRETGAAHELNDHFGVAERPVGIRSQHTVRQDVRTPALRNFIPYEIRIPVFILIIAALVTVVDLAFNAYLHELYLVLGIFIPLIVTNCIVLARVEAFAAKNEPGGSTVDGIAMGIGLTLVLAVLGAMREAVAALP